MRERETDGAINTGETHQVNTRKERSSESWRQQAEEMTHFHNLAFPGQTFTSFSLISFLVICIIKTTEVAGPGHPGALKLSKH